LPRTGGVREFRPGDRETNVEAGQNVPIAFLASRRGISKMSEDHWNGGFELFPSRADRNMKCPAVFSMKVIGHSKVRMTGGSAI
jgi:hypothetical protein